MPLPPPPFPPQVPLAHRIDLPADGRVHCMTFVEPEPAFAGWERLTGEGAYWLTRRPEPWWPADCIRLVPAPPGSSVPTYRSPLPGWTVQDLLTLAWLRVIQEAGQFEVDMFNLEKVMFRHIILARWPDAIRLTIQRSSEELEAELALAALGGGPRG